MADPAPSPTRSTLLRIAAAVAALAALAGSCLLILAIVFALGTSPAEFYEGAIAETWQIARHFVLPFTSPNAAPDWGIAAIAAAAWSLWAAGSSVT